MASKHIVATVDGDGVVEDLRDDSDGRERSVEEIAEAEKRRDGWAHVDVAVVRGEVQQLSFEVDHRKTDPDGSPMVSSIVTKMPRLYVEGEFNGGDRVRLEVELLIEYASFPPIKEKGVRVGTERKHHAEVVRVKQPKPRRG